MSQRIHEGHMGIRKSIQRANDVIWWPGITSEIKSFVSKCNKGLERKPNSHEMLLPSTLPWQVIGTDLAERDGKNYLI